MIFLFNLLWHWGPRSKLSSLDLMALNTIMMKLMMRWHARLRTMRTMVAMERRSEFTPDEILKLQKARKFNHVETGS